ncbi:MAG: 30S ribosomal protein S17 [Acidilobaceae archaeon]|nr:30S ribosomal protein S17 [Acidilobaceae archaeon]MCX8166052.1 30S ribosomal protein S17 [Acidilobaceae archaeon]MDW7974695.1 30S ribosomal protein S17 [Sulfolobales archaeon]
MPAPSQLKELRIPGINPPKERCEDEKCPWHGSLRVRGVLLEGVVLKAKAQKMVVVSHEYLRYDDKYKRYERRRKKIHARLPPCVKVEVGQRVVIGETRPLAKTVRFVVLGVKAG